MAISQELQPKILLVASAKDLADDCACWLAGSYRVELASTIALARKELCTRPDILIMIEINGTDLELQMPQLGSLALEQGARVIHLAGGTHRFDSRWDPRTIILPLGVRPSVLLSAIKGYRGKGAQA